jgi:pyrroline-5-carboxylate reductase
MKRLADVQIGCLGCGIMGRILIERLIRSGQMAPTAVVACDPEESRLEAAQRELGIRVSPDNRVGAEADVIIIAPPPAAVLGVLAEIANQVTSDKLIISVAAGVRLANMAAVLPAGAMVVRVMPGAPALLGAGMNAYAVGSEVSEAGRALLAQMLQLWGSSVEIPEQMMNAACALLAVGPTYLLPVAASLTESAVQAGLPAATAREIAAGLFAGVGALLAQTERTCEDLKNMISLQTLDEETATRLFAQAYSTALTRLNGMEQKLCG